MLDEFDPEEIDEWPEQWCKCGYMGFVQLFDLGGTKQEEAAQVCGACLWPSRMYWENYIETCSECGQEFNAPWEDLCSDCVYRFPSNRPDAEPYLDWQWARITAARTHYRPVNGLESTSELSSVSID